VEWGEALGQADLMEAGSAYGVIAYAAIDRVARWVSDVAPTSRQALKPPPAAGSAVVGRTATGVPILETPVFLGNTGLFGILTEAPGRPPGPTAVFLSVANATHTGLDHLWVELARRWAASGFRCVRFDHSGLGDSPTRNERQPRFVSCAPEAFDDVAEVCAAVSPDDPANVVLVGFCTSGYQVLESALYLKPRGVVSFNPGLSFRPPETAKGGRVDPRRRIALPRRAFVGAYYANHYQGPAPAGVLHRYSNLGRVARAVAAPKARTARWLRDHQRDVVTNVTWRLRMLSSPDRRPARWMKELIDDGTEVFIVSSKGDARPLQVGVSKAQLEDWRRRGLHFVYISDHLLRVPSERASVTETVTAHMVHRFAEPAATAEAPSALAPSA
jgi:pimeloyl-ACP methyl ester carboxylesterase